MKAWRTLRQARRHDHPEDGQVLVLFAAGLVGFLALLALSIDVGLMVFTRTDLQKTADAAAFAAAQDLPNTATAENVALDYVEENHSGAGAQVTFSAAGSQPDTVNVVAERQIDLFFGGFVGIDSVDISAEATVRVASYTGGSGLLPFGFVASNNSNSTLLQNPCYAGWENGEPAFHQNMECEVKYGAGDNAGGDFGALGLDGPGANTYRNSIKEGTDGVFKKGDKVNPETGNMSGPTRQGIQHRLNQPPPSGCPGNSRSDVLISNDDGVGIRPGCEDSYRIGIIPVVDKIDNPQKSTILGFAYVYLVDQVPGQGNNSSVKVEFVEFTNEIPGGEYDGTNLDGSTLAKLVD